MTVTPQGQIYLCKCPLNKDNKNQLTFSNLTAQLNYFNSIVYRNYGDGAYTYIKKDSSVKIGVNIDDIISCNYLFYKNTGFSSKYYFCFITKMEYINENCTIVYFETDSFQTYQFDISFNKCFVEREHVNNDTIGLHTVPESLEHGEYIHNNFSKFGLQNSVNDLCIIIASTINFFKYTDENAKFPVSTVVNGIFSGVTYYVMKDNYTDAGGNTYSSAGTFLQSAAYHGQVDAIQGVFLVPKILVDYNNISWDSPETGLLYHFYKKLPDSYTPYNLGTFAISKNYAFGSYTPVNNKLLCYPYNFFMVDNNNGRANEYKYEDFSTSTCNFDVKAVLCPRCIN